MVIDTDSEPSPKTQRTTIFNDNYCIAVPQKHALASLNTVPIKALMHESLLLLDEMSSKRARALGLANSRVCAVHAQSLLDLVLATSQPGLIPENTANRVSPALRLIPIQGNMLQRHTFAHWHEDATQRSEALQATQPH